jgi:hypothetical protein
MNEVDGSERFGVGSAKDKIQKFKSFKKKKGKEAKGGGALII